VAELVWQFYTWDYEPNASLFGSMKGAEPVHIQMNLPDCRIAVMNHQAEPLVDVTATATIYDLSGHKEQKQKKKFTAAADAGTDVFTLELAGHRRASGQAGTARCEGPFAFR
jgi:hypothetical protein